MTFTTTIIAFLIIIGMYVILSKYYFERVLKIKSVSKGVFSKDRKKRYVYLELLFSVVFLVTALSFIEIYLVPNLLIFIFLSLLYVLRGIEEWRENKSQKGYYHQWLAAAMYLALFFVALIRFSSFI